MRSTRSAAGVFGAATAVALGAGVAVGGLLGLWTATLNEIVAPKEIGALWLQLAGLYTGVFAAGLLVLAVAAIACGRRPGMRFFAAEAAAASAFLNGLLRFHLPIQPLSVTPHLSLVGLGELFGVAAVSALVFAAVAGSGRRARLAAVVAAAGLWAGLAAFQRWHERPLRRDLAALVPPLVADATRSFTPRAEGRFEGAKLVVLGIDGLGVEVALPLLRRGELPNLAWLLRDAAFGYLDTLKPTISPAIWETISTGRPPNRHRIGHHEHWSFAGIADRIRFLPAFPIGDNTLFGMRHLVAATRPVAPWRPAYHDATDARAARLWEILDRRGIPVGLYHWMNTAPVSRLATGFMKGYETVPPREWPPDLEAGFAEPLPEQDGIPLQRAFWSRFVDLALRHRPQVLLYYTHFADAQSHWNWKRDAVGPGLFYAGLRHGAFEPGREISEANRLVDDLVGDALSRLPDEATLVVVSDHGFEFIGYEHDNAPPGLIALRGPEVRPGPIEGASVYDVAPTLLHLLGVPVAEDMPGRVLPVWRAGSLLDHAPRTVSSHGSAAQPVAVGQASEEEQRRTEEYLRSLGYVN